MSRSSRLISAAAVTLLLAACGQGNGNPVLPEGPSMDGGYATGGNRTDTTTVATAPSSTTEDAGATVQSDTTGRGGYATGGN